MKRETVMAALQLVGAMRGSLEETHRLVDAEALQVGDRNLIDGSLTTIENEIRVLSRTFEDMLNDETKIERA
jgi:hypothetical protein